MMFFIVSILALIKLDNDWGIGLVRNSVFWGPYVFCP